MPLIPSATSSENQVKPSRRNFLLLAPFGILAGVIATMATTAFRFLRPFAGGAGPSWIDVANLAEIKGDRPILKRVVTDEQTAWSTSREEHFVYILPKQNNSVVTAVCPHEGCNVAWSDQNNGFLCPCHDSLFASDGSRVKGPSRRGVDPLPAREQDGKLQVQYLSFVNNTADREVLG